MQLTRTLSLPPRLELVAIAVFCALAVTFRSVHVVTIPSFTVLINTLGAVFDIATVIVLALLVRFEANRLALWWLITMYASAAIFAVTRAFLVPLLPADPQALDAPLRATAWLFALAASSFIAGSVIFTILRRTAARREVGPWVPVAFFAFAIVVAGSEIAAVLRSSPSLPMLLPGLHGSIRTSGFGPICVLIGLGVVASLTLWKHRSALDGAVAFTLACFVSTFVLIMASPERFCVAWYATTVSYLIGSFAVLASSIRHLIQSQHRLEEARAQTARAQQRAIATADRLRGLWAVVSDSQLSDFERVRALVDVGSRTLRPGSVFSGNITHLEGDRSVMDLVMLDGFSAERRAPIEDICFPGASMPFDQTLLAKIAAHGSALGWSDLRALDGSDMMFSSAGFKSYIGAPFFVDRDTYFLFFASDEPMLAEPFDSDDYAFVDVLAAFVQSRFSIQKQVERIKFQIEHDALTGLANRTQFRLKVRSALRDEQPSAVMLIDLDDFSRVNAMSGYQLGDEVLVEIASELRGVDANDFVARLGGDDFGVLLKGVGSRQEAAARMARYKNVFATPFHIGDATGTGTRIVHASIGLVETAIVAKPDVDDLLRRLDFVVATAKARGGDDAIMFDASMSEAFTSRMLLRDELEHAIAHDELELWYQPTFDLGSGSVRGAEGLVRWRHPKHGLILPAEFVPFAEANGLIRTLGRWVMARAVRDLATVESLAPMFRCFVNLSSHQLGDEHFLTDVRDHLERFPHLARHLGIEITETAAVRNVEQSKYTFKYLQRYGLKIALDDFGTEYSSLAYLKDLPLDVIKIDRTFVNGLPTDEKDAALCETLLSIGARFHIETLAEGIERVEQRDWLYKRGCRLGQGYLFERPMQWADFHQRYLQTASAVRRPMKRSSRA